jgi:hypothetical protein
MSTEIRHDGGSMYVRTSDTVYNRDEYRGVLIVQSDSDPHSGNDQAICIMSVSHRVRRISADA